MNPLGSWMRRRILAHLVPVLLALFLVGCTPSTPTGTPQLISVFASPATRPWLADVYACAQQISAVVRLVDTPSNADVAIRIGQPEDLVTPAFQIDTEDILVVTHRESPVQNLTEDQVRALFAGRGNEGAQVWVFAAGDDVQQIFEQQIMRGAAITSMARLATSPQQMSDILNNDMNAVGILPRHWKVGTVRDVYTLADVPVLAMTPSQPSGLVKDLLACLQK